MKLKAYAPLIIHYHWFYPFSLLLGFISKMTCFRNYQKSFITSPISYIHRDAIIKKPAFSNEWFRLQVSFYHCSHMGTVGSLPDKWQKSRTLLLCLKNVYRSYWIYPNTSQIKWVQYVQYELLNVTYSYFSINVPIWEHWAAYHKKQVINVK